MLADHFEWEALCFHLFSFCFAPSCAFVLVSIFNWPSLCVQSRGCKKSVKSVPPSPPDVPLASLAKGISYLPFLPSSSHLWEICKAIRLCFFFHVVFQTYLIVLFVTALSFNLAQTVYMMAQHFLRLWQGWSLYVLLPFKCWLVLFLSSLLSLSQLHIRFLGAWFTFQHLFLFSTKSFSNLNQSKLGIG